MMFDRTVSMAEFNYERGYEDGKKDAAQLVEALVTAMLECAHAHLVPDAGDGQPGVLVSKRHSDFVSCPVCDALYEWGSTEPKAPFTAK